MKHKWLWIFLLVAMMAGTFSCFMPYGHRGYYSDSYRHGRSHHQHYSHHERSHYRNY